MNKFLLLGVVCLSAALLSGCGSAQGTESYASASGSDGSGLASSSAPADHSFALSPEKQLQVMADHVQDWQVSDEWDWWGYTVADLDQDDQLEQIVSQIQGTGGYTTNTVWQVNDDGSGLSQVKTQDSCQPVFQPDDFQGTPTSTLRAYQNQSDGVFTYILEDSNKDGAAHYYQSKRAIALKDGALKGFFLGYQNTEYDENGQEQVTYQDAQEQTISQQDYDQVEQRYFGDFQPCTATLSWLDCVPGDQLAGTDLADRLAACWQDFSITANA